MKSIENAYNLWAKIYDSNANKTRDLDQEASIQTLSKYDFNDVLELGCGTGKNTIFLLEKAQNIIAVDFSDKMLEKAKEKIRDKRVDFIKADLNKEWNLKNKYFDLITCSLTLEHIQNIDFVFYQAYQRLIQGGHFFVCELHPFKQYLGSKARFETDEGIEVLETYTHHLSDYLHAAHNSGLRIVDIDEWFDKDNTDLPRLISFVFRKTK